MEILASFCMLFKSFQDVMTRPTFDSLKMIVLGWLFASRRTVTGMIVAAEAVGKKHHSAFHRVFSAARWSLDHLGLALFDAIEPWLGDTVLLALDDTLARKNGLKVFGVGMHHDPLLSSRNKSITSWGHSWVVLWVCPTSEHFFGSLLENDSSNRKNAIEIPGSEGGHFQDGVPRNRQRSHGSS